MSKEAPKDKSQWIKKDINSGRFIPDTGSVKKQGSPTTPPSSNKNDSAPKNSRSTGTGPRKRKE